MATPCQKRQVFSLYRTCLRQIGQLPHIYLREFFRIKAADDIRAILTTKDVNGLRGRKIKRFSKETGKIGAAIRGNTAAFSRILDLAYGRRGKLKRELMEPLLSDPKAPIPPRIIPSVEKSRPPVYSKPLAALLTSAPSRLNKPIGKVHLDFPRTLPAQAHPSSEDARLLGPFSKRREVNIRWRAFVEESRKVLPPLQVVVNKKNHADTSDASLIQEGIRGLGFQGKHVFEDIETLIGEQPRERPMTRKEREAMQGTVEVPAAPQPTPRHSSRWIRRRYQQLLGKLPILTYNVVGDTRGPYYKVSLSKLAITPEMSLDRFVTLDPDNDAWFQYATKGSKDTKQV